MLKSKYYFCLPQKNNSHRIGTAFLLLAIKKIPKINQRFIFVMTIIKDLTKLEIFLKLNSIEKINNEKLNLLILAAL